MATNLYATDRNPSYENFDARCPHCKKIIRFNRASDLKDLSPISFKEVRCLNKDCQQLFNINGDLVNSLHEMLISDCYDLKNEKRYSYCILNLAQAFEAFFSIYLRVYLLYRPFARVQMENSDEDYLNHLNSLASTLYDTTKTYTFADLRNVFLNRVLANTEVSSLNEVKPIILSLPNLRKEPPDSAIAACQNPQLADFLRHLKRSMIGQQRNRVVHQRAYRPTLMEVEAALKETREIIFPLSSVLEVQGDDINWYMSPAYRSKLTGTR